MHFHFEVVCFELAKLLAMIIEILPPNSFLEGFLLNSFTVLVFQISLALVLYIPDFLAYTIFHQWSNFYLFCQSHGDSFQVSLGFDLAFFEVPEKKGRAKAIETGTMLLIDQLAAVIFVK